MRLGSMIGIAALCLATPALAEDVRVNAPAGRVGDVAIAIARQTGSSIVIAERDLGNRMVSGIRGRLSAEAAVERLARAAGARAIRAGDNSWRLVPLDGQPRRRIMRRTQQAAPPPAPAVTSAPPVEPPVPIVVVASKRDTVLSEFPGQVTMVDGEELTFGGVGGTEKIIQRVPTVTSTFLGSGRNKLFIRGIADSSFTGPTQSTVAQYLGDLRLSYNAPDPDLRLADLARVEVLEGPQGTLYGAGSLGGIVRLVPNDPVNGLVAASGMAGGSVTRHGAPGADASLTANLPLIGERAALRFTVTAQTQGGYIDKPALDRKDVNRTGILSGRGAIRVDVTDDWTVDISAVGQRTDGRDSQYADRDGPPLTRSARVTEGHDATYAQGQLVLTGRLGALRFKSSTGFTTQELEERYDATLPLGEPRLFLQHNDTEMVANETRLWRPLDDRLGWLVGASYTHNRTRLTRTLGPPDALSTVAGVTNVVDEITLFGEGSLRLGPSLIVTGGGRFNRSRLSGRGEDVSPALATRLSDVTATRVEKEFLPSAAITAELMPRTAIYARYQEGFRPGGLAIADDFVRRFSNDRISTLELGGRHGQPGRGAFDLAASIAYTTWRDIQADFIDPSGFPSTANIGDGRIWTATVVAGVAVGPDLRVEAGLTWNDSRITQPSEALLRSAAAALGRPVFVGTFADLPLEVLERITQVPNVANLAGRLGVNYLRPLANGLELSAQGWATYVGRSRLGIGPELGDEQGDYLDTGLTVRVGHQALGLTLGLTNLTNEEGNRFALGTPFTVGRSQITPLRPRTVRVGIDAAF